MLLEEKHKTIEIPLNQVVLKGNLFIPENARALVLFSHGSGSSRLSPRNNYVAGVLQHEGLATLLFDLLTEEEDRLYKTRFNIDLLTQRLIEVTEWIKTQKETKGLQLAYFGASTGAASALSAAAYFGDEIAAVVSRGGRPDLAMSELYKVTAPTLLIVGGWDKVVIVLNQKAYGNLRCEKKLEIIPGATHLFEESGKLEAVAAVSAKWFTKHLQPKKS
ncbi:dienelactone hydrolase family protein [uncultured Eudoraea sp.]|jgi:dienelactone hydrolase|uniref:dienelactone hydrolase family protein n=1 Tax=uncultured Eudoraea sp. TaxID=1035614 RepID=UPI002639188C|nr:alpha/beta hydrolase [uncultured Eudoraea sp.]